MILSLVLCLAFSQPLGISAQEGAEAAVEPICDEEIPASSKAAFYVECNRLPEYLKEIVSGSGVTFYLDSGREHTGINTGLFTAWVPMGEYDYDYSIHIDSSRHIMWLLQHCMRLGIWLTVSLVRFLEIWAAITALSVDFRRSIRQKQHPPDWGNMPLPHRQSISPKRSKSTSRIPDGCRRMLRLPTSMLKISVPCCPALT